MDYFRNIVVIAALAGLIAGLGMTMAQELTTVPLILKAETFEQAEDAKAPAAKRRKRRRAMSMTRVGRRKTASSAPPSPSPPMC